MALCLGKKLGVVHDRRTLSVRALVDAPAVKVPHAHDIAHTVEEFPVFLNEELGDCGLASNGHRVIGQERSAGQHDLPVTDADVLAAYEAVGGYRPGHPETDNGVYLLDVCNYLRKTGMGRQRDGSPHTITGFAKVDPTNHDEVRLASYVFGGLYIGAALPVAAQDQVGQLWQLTGDEHADKFGSWGGHAMWAPAYDVQGVGVVTWGRRQRATWEWWDTYVDEAYALVSPDFMRRGGKTPQGFNADALARFLETLR